MTPESEEKKMNDLLAEAVERYASRSGNTPGKVHAVLFDMDGVLYDSMPGHARAWKQMCDENGIVAEEDEFYAYEGRTGASTIDILFRRQFDRGATEEDVRRLYARKSEIFKALGLPRLMPGAFDAVSAVLSSGALPVLVTGSGQASILERLATDYPEAFPPERRVTSHDVRHGKPDPEPYLMGLEKAGVALTEAVAVDNAPLGVESASRAGILTIGVRTGPLPQGMLLEAGADVEVDSMQACAQMLRFIFTV